MARTPRQFPVGPAIVSLLLVLLGAAYLARRTPGEIDVAPAGQGMARVVSWNPAAEGGAVPSNQAIASLLVALNADTVCLQGLSSAEQAAAIGHHLGRQWKFQTLPDPWGRHLLVAAGPRLEVVAYHLIPTPVGDAVALTLRRPGRPAFHLVCLDAAAQAGDADTRQRYLAGVLGWCDAHSAALTVLAGKLDPGRDLRRHLTERFVEACVSPTRSSEIRVAPPAAVIAQAGTVSQAGSVLAVADVGLP
jgi:hypothetical protein